MAKILHTILILGFILFFSCVSIGQEDSIDMQSPLSPRRGIAFVRVGGNYSSPSNAFRRNLNQPIGGIYLNIDYQIKPNKPLFIGLGVQHLWMQYHSSTVTRVFDNFSEEWDAGTTSALIQLDLHALYFPELRIFGMEPYFSAGVGANFFYGSTSFTYPDSDESDSDWEGGDAAMMYVGAIGAMVYLTEDWYLDASIGYNAGLSTQYFVRKDPLPTPEYSTIEVFERKQSTTDYVSFKVGINFNF